MRHGHRDQKIKRRGGGAYSQCGKKKKFKGSVAGKLAHKLGQRKYQCPICGDWHLTKTKKRY